ncbi:MAG: hypothetical protein R2752_18560, partial [Vicinamibacterales bacterium]
SDVPPDVLPELVRERLSESERALFERVAALEAPPANAADCVGALRRLRLERERMALQDEIDRLQDEAGAAAGPERAGRLRDLWERKRDLIRKLEAI